MVSGGPTFPFRPGPRLPQPGEAAPEGAYHSWAGTMEVATVVMVSDSLRNNSTVWMQREGGRKWYS